MSALITGLIGGITALALGYLSHRHQKAALTDAEGWKRLRPSWFLHLAFVGCAVFAALIIGVLAAGGSDRPDAASQNYSAIGLMLFFAGSALYLGLSIYGRTIRWKGEQIHVRGITGVETIYHRSNICSVDSNELSSTYKLKFRDGSVLRCSTHLRGASELVAHVRAKLG